MEKSYVFPWRKDSRFSSMETKILWILVFSTLLITIFYPFAVLIYKSFTGSGEFGSAYKLILEDKETYVYLLNTLKLAFTVTALSVFIGLPIAFLVTRTDFPFKKLIRLLVLTSFILPPYISAIAWIQIGAPFVGYANRILASIFNVPSFFNIFSFFGLVLVMTFKYYVYVFLTVSAALENMDPSYEEAARMSGTTPLRAVFEISIPMILPSIFSGALLVFISVCSNFGIPSLIGERANFYVLTTKIYSALTIPDLNRAVAYSMVLIVITGSVLLFQRYLSKENRFTTITGKASRPSLICLGNIKYFFLFIVGIFLILSAVIPLLSLFLSAFLKNPILPIFNISSYTLSNFKFILFKDETTTLAIRTSFSAALLAATVITFFGSLVAYMITRTNIRFKFFVDLLSSIPYILPGTVVGVAIILAFIKTPIFDTFWIIPLAYFIRYLSYGVRTSVGALLQIDKSLEEASIMSGASWLKTLRKIVFPLIKPSLIAGWMLVFMPAVSELTVSIIIYPSDFPTIGVATYNLMEEGSYSLAYALSAFVTLVVFLSYIFVSYISKRFPGGET